MGFHEATAAWASFAAAPAICRDAHARLANARISVDLARAGAEKAILREWADPPPRFENSTNAPCDTRSRTEYMGMKRATRLPRAGGPVVASLAVALLAVALALAFCFPALAQVVAPATKPATAPPPAAAPAAPQLGGPAPLAPGFSAPSPAPAPTAPAAETPAVGGAPVAATEAPKRKPKPKPKPAPPRETALSDDPTPVLQPETFFATSKASERYASIVDAGGWPKVGVSLRAGAKGPAVAALRRRLAAEDDNLSGAGSTWDGALTAAVKRFQFRMGLRQTGEVSGATLRALDVPAATRFRQLASSAQRLAGVDFPFGPRYVVVNIPSTAVDAVENDRVVHRYTAIVGDVRAPLARGHGEDRRR